MSKVKQQTKISEDLVLIEMESFLSKWIKNVPETEELQSKYPNIFDAFSSGNLSVDEKGVPTYKLLNPITQKDFETTEIVFRTRIKASTKADLSRGLDLTKEVIKYSNILKAYILGFASHRLLDELSKFDEDLTSEVSALFI